MAYSVTAVVTRRGGLPRSLLGIIEASNFVVPSPLEASAFPRIQGPHIPQRTFIETSKCMHRTRFCEICGTGKNTAIIDEPLRSKCPYTPRSPVCGRSDGILSRSTKALVLWIFCYTRGCLRWSGLYRQWRTFRCSELRRVK